MLGSRRGAGCVPSGLIAHSSSLPFGLTAEADDPTRPAFAQAAKLRRYWAPLEADERPGKSPKPKGASELRLRLHGMLRAWGITLYRCLVQDTFLQNPTPKSSRSHQTLVLDRASANGRLRLPHNPALPLDTTGSHRGSASSCVARKPLVELDVFTDIVGVT